MIKFNTGHVETVRQMLTSELVNIDVEDNNGMSALLWATENGSSFSIKICPFQF